MNKARKRVLKISATLILLLTVFLAVKAFSAPTPGELYLYLLVWGLVGAVIAIVAAILYGAMSLWARKSGP